MFDVEGWRRRDVLGWAAAAAAGQLLPRDAWGGPRPAMAGVMSGDPGFDHGLIWAQSDRPARLWVEWSTRENFAFSTLVRGQDALPGRGFAAKAFLPQLPEDRTIFYRTRFEDLQNLGTYSAEGIGRFRTPSTRPRDLRIGWGGDVAGQGFGIDVARGGFRTFETMRKKKLDVFIHSGDFVYADNPLNESLDLPDGSKWKNLVTPAKAKVAETLEEFRGQYAYNLLDPSYRAFFSETSLIAQWDDHETLNNWYPSENLEDDRYRERSVALLAARAERAFRDSLPIAPRLQPGFYRKAALGPLIDVFVLDARTFRGPNGPNRENQRSPNTAFFGVRQLEWLKRGLLESSATWKVLASDMPMGLVVSDGVVRPGSESPILRHEGLANAHPELGGRELELADLLGFIQKESVRNVLFVTADVHYAAAHRYDPRNAVFGDFEPFWEFVAGPLHAGTFGPNDLDPTFGPEVVFTSRKEGLPNNLAPSEGAQYFGVLEARAKDRRLEVGLFDRAGKAVFTQTLLPA